MNDHQQQTLNVDLCYYFQKCYIMSGAATAGVLQILPLGP